jgi:hypothetical protein
MMTHWYFVLPGAKNPKQQRPTTLRALDSASADLICARGQSFDPEHS